MIGKPWAVIQDNGDGWRVVGRFWRYGSADAVALEYSETYTFLVAVVHRKALRRFVK